MSTDNFNALSEISHEHLTRWAHRVTDELKLLSNVSRDEVPKKIFELFHSIRHFADELTRLLQEENVQITTVHDNLEALAHRAKRMMEIVEAEAIEPPIFDQLIKLTSLLQEAPPLHGRGVPTENFRQMIENAELARMGDAVNILVNQLASARNENNRVRREVKDAQRATDELSRNISSLNETIHEIVAAAVKNAETITEELRQKQDEVNDLVGLVSGSTMASSFAKSAEDERRLANSMRNGSVMLMLIIVGIVGLSFFETTHPRFDWQTGAFRMLFSVALSVPAAYLARESSKHRAQQNSHLRIALDLQAITPYLASLPTEEQHKLKVEVANKIFGANDATVAHPESYPINVNDLLKILVTRMELKNPKKSDNSDD